MASRDEPARHGPREGNLPLRSRRGPVNQEGEEAEAGGAPSPGLISLNNGGDGQAELQAIYRSLCSWLRPYSHSKLEMIFQLSVEQFLCNMPSSERAAWREKWESCGRDIEAFMGHLTDECPRPPRMVSVRIGGQEALFPENMPIGQVRACLLEQRSAAALMALTQGTPSQTPPETPRPAAPGHADGNNLSSPDHQPPTLLILEGESPQGPAESEGSGESSRSSGSAGGARKLKMYLWGDEVHNPRNVP